MRLRHATTAFRYAVVASLVAPVRALLESTERPVWVEGGQPGR